MDAAGVNNTYEEEGLADEFLQADGLGGQAEAAEFVGRATIIMYGQQIGAGAASTGVELEAEQAHGVDTETDGAFGEAGLQVETKALTPFFTFVLTRTFAEVAIEIDVGSGEAGTAVFDESGVGKWCSAGSGDG